MMMMTMMMKARNAEAKKIFPRKSFRNREQNQNQDIVDNAFARKSFCEIYVPLLFLLWCGVVFFHPTFTRGNEGDLLGFKPNGEKWLNHTVTLGEIGGENITSRRIMAPNVSVSVNKTRPITVKNSIRPTTGLDELVALLLDHGSLTCRIKPQEYKVEPELEARPNERIQLPYLNLDDFKHISRQEKNDSRRHINITHRLEPNGTPYNYASSSKGAKVVTHNKEAKGANNILGEDHDKYLRNPCSVEDKFIIIELSDETLVDTVKIANFEHYSSNFKDVELSGSLVYPTKDWNVLGSFVAANSKHMQHFKLPEPKWVRYLRVKLLSHYGSEFYCTLSVVEVYGVDAIEQMLGDLIVTSGESSTNSTAVPVVIPELGPEKPNIDDVAHPSAEGMSKGASIDVAHNLATRSDSEPPMPKVSQHPNNRLHADAALKVVLQKVRLIESNLSVLEEFIKELHRRRGDVLPELEKELSKFNVLLEKSKLEMKNIMEWKEVMEKEFLELEAWRVVVSTQMELLMTQNSMMRLEVEKVLHDQASLEKKGLAILTVGLSFACIAILNILSGSMVKIFRPPKSSGGCTIVFVFCSMTMLIPVLYG